MSDNPKVVGFPQPEVSPEEMIRRQRLEAERLAGLSPGEWVLWIDRSAAQLGVPRGPLAWISTERVSTNETRA
jgi:hypothetical protein